MKRNSIPLAICLLLSAVSHTGAAEKEQFQIQSQMFWVRGSLSGETALDEEIWAGKRPQYLDIQKTLSYFTSARFQVGGDRLVINENGWLWNDKKFNDPGTQWTIPSSAASHALVVPRISVLDGEIANITMQSDQEIEYFEQSSPDTFKLRKLKEPTGLRIVLRPEREREDRIRLSELTLSIRVVEKREPIPGVTLQVGRPILQTREYRAAPIRVRPAKDYGILLSLGRDQGVLIFRFRVGPASDTLQSNAATAKKEGE